MLDVVRQRTMSWGGQPVNRVNCPIVKYSPELTHLLETGAIERKLLPRRGLGANHWISVTHLFVPVMDISYLRRIRCPLCQAELSHWYDVAGHKHKEGCMLRHEKV